MGNIYDDAGMVFFFSPGSCTFGFGFGFAFTVVRSPTPGLGPSQSL